MAFITDCDSIAPIPMMGQIDSPKIKENGNAYQPEEKTVKENRCCMVCWIPCSSGLCCGYYFIRFLNIRR